MIGGPFLAALLSVSVRSLALPTFTLPKFTSGGLWFSDSGTGVGAGVGAGVGVGVGVGAGAAANALTKVLMSTVPQPVTKS